MQSRIAPSGSSRPGAHVFRTTAGLCIALSLLAAVAPVLAAVAYVNSSSSSLGSSGTSSVTMTAPSGLVSGDVMVAWVAQDTSGLPAVSAAPSGWTQVLEQDDGSSIGTAVYYRVATSSDVAGTTNYTWSFQQSARSGGLIVAFSGVSTTSPVVASASQANGSSGSYTAPSITPGVANTMLLALFAADSGNATMATPAGTTSAFAGSTGAGPNGIAIGAFYEPLSASTATGQVQSSGNNSATNVGATLALQPAAGGGGGGSAASGFNAVDGYLSSYPASTAAQRIYTKLAGTGFTLNVAALNSATPTPGLLSPAYVSGTNKVTVDLVDDSDGSCAASCAGSTCQAKAALATLTTSFVSGDSSYKKGLSFTLADAYPNVRVRVKDASNSPTVYACSVDHFSVRPTSLTVTSSANADPSGASATATPVVKAGATFALTATAVAGYSGTPSVNGSAVTVNPLSPGVASGSFGAANASNGVATGNFAYSEAGYFTLNTDAVYDQSFTSVDQAGDCTADYSNTLVNGKYGCYFGNSATTAFGRFVPDHFAITAGSVTPACGSFTYFDQDGFVTTFTLTAQNSSNATTLNYTGSFARLGLIAWAGYVFTGDTATPSASATAPTGSWSNGVASISAEHQVLVRPTTTPAAPVSVTVSARPVDPDGVTTAAPTAVMSAGTPMRFGVLAVGSAYGSDLLTLRLPVTAMVWNGTGLVTNSADTCTGAVLSNASIALGNLVQKPGTSGSFSTSVQASPTLASTWSQGTSSIALAAPGTAGTAQIALNLGSGSADASCIGWSVASTGSHLPWLRGNWCSSGYASDPSSLASFGTGATPFVYFRENH